jgi:hypothetical protein
MCLNHVLIHGAKLRNVPESPFVLTEEALERLIGELTSGFMS